MPRRSSPSVRVFFPRFDRETLVGALRERLPALAARLPLVRVVLFGSWARGTHTVASDVDLLALPGIEPHTYAVDEAEAMGPRLERMIAGGVVLHLG